MTPLLFFLNLCSLLVFLYFCAFPISAKKSRFHLSSPRINIYQRSFTITFTTLLSSVYYLYVTALIGSQLFSRHLAWNTSFCYMVTHYTLFFVFRTLAFNKDFHRLPFNFLMRRPTCVSASMILSLSFLFTTCRNEEIGGA